MHQNAATAQTGRSTAVVDSRLSGVREQLQKQRHFRAQQLRELAADAAEALAAVDEPRLEVITVLTMAAESVLREIDAALARLDEGGSYGLCERCAKPIRSERFEVLPMAGLCTPCQYLLDSSQPLPNRPRTG